MLTNREMEIMGLLAGGYSSKEVAQKLFISHATARTHRNNIMEKTNSHNLADITRKYIESFGLPKQQRNEF